MAIEPAFKVAFNLSEVNVFFVFGSHSSLVHDAWSEAFSIQGEVVVCTAIALVIKACGWFLKQTSIVLLDDILHIGHAAIADLESRMVKDLVELMTSWEMLVDK